MSLSKSGVVVIDDTFEEIKPLLDCFNSLSIPYYYFTGRSEELPKTPVKAVRFVFLDIELEDSHGLNYKTKASLLINRLKKIISEENGPYGIIFWTKHSEIIKRVLEDCNTANIAPFFWVDLEKPTKEDFSSLGIATIKEKISQKLKDIGAFPLLVEWENNLFITGQEFINNFSSLAKQQEKKAKQQEKKAKQQEKKAKQQEKKAKQQEKNEDWQKEWSETISKIFYQLYKSYVDKNTSDNDILKYQSASVLLNKSFLDFLQKKSLKNLNPPEGFRFIEDTINNCIKAKINSTILLDNHVLGTKRAGCLFIEENNDRLFNSILEAVFSDANSIDNRELCYVILTPECDIAQKKILPSNTLSSEYHRVLYGLLYSKVDNQKPKFKDSGKDSRYPFGPFWYKEKEYHLIFHFGTLNLKKIPIRAKPVFALKQDLHFDLQSKTANAVNRLGNVYIS